MKPRTARSRSELAGSRCEIDQPRPIAQHDRAAGPPVQAWRYRWRSAPGAPKAWSIWHYTEADPRRWREVPDHIQALSVTDDIRKEHSDGTPAA